MIINKAGIYPLKKEISSLDLTTVSNQKIIELGQSLYEFIGINFERIILKDR